MPMGSIAPAAAPHPRGFPGDKPWTCAGVGATSRFERPRSEKCRRAANENYYEHVMDDEIPTNVTAMCDYQVARINVRGLVL
jgi:hypothetical protein